MQSYVFIGFSSAFGDFTDIVHACGGYVRKVVINLPRDMPLGAMTFDERIAHYDNFLKTLGTTNPVEVQHLRDFRPDPADHHVMAARGLRLQPLQQYLTGTLGVRLVPLVHPSAIISPTVILPEGIIVRAGAKVGSAAVLGAHSGIGSMAAIGHDCRLAAYTQLNLGAKLASETKVEKGATVGMGAMVINGCTIGEEALVAAGAVVTQDVEPLTMVAGVPAVAKKKLERREIPKGVPGLDT